MKQLILIIFLCISCALFAQPTSRSTFFVANEGQWPGEFSFRYDGSGGSWYVTDQGMTIDLKQYERDPLARKGFDAFAIHDERENRRPTRVKGHVLKANLINGNLSAVIEGTDKLSSYSNYFFGQDKSKWRSRVGHYSKVIAKEVWTGIDVEYEAKKQGVETFFRVQPGADVSQIQIEYEGLEAPLSVDSKGNLVLKTSLGSLIEKAPFAYQIENHRQREIPVHFVLTGDNNYRLSVDNYNHGRELVIDPLLYGSYFGSGYVNNMCLDFHGKIILAGATYSSVFPITPGAYQTEIAGNVDAFVSKFTPDGRELMFSTYLGGPQHDSFYACINDLQNQIHVGGACRDGDYPLTTNAYDTVSVGLTEATYSVLSEDGTELLYSTYLGGNREDITFALELDPSSGEIYVLGKTTPEFETTPNALYPTCPDNTTSGMIVIFNPESYIVEYATYFPASVSYTFIRINTGEVIDYRKLWIAGLTYNSESSPGLPITENAFQTEHVHLGSESGFFALLDLESNTLEYSSYLGSYGADEVTAISADNDGRIVLAGETLVYPGNEFPFCHVAFDTIVDYRDVYILDIELPNTLVHGTCLGNSAFEKTLYVKRQPDSSIIVIGGTDGEDFPLTPNAFDTTIGSQENETEIFISRFSPDLTELEYSTFLGGANNDFATGVQMLNKDTLWIAGYSQSVDFVMTLDAYQSTLQYGQSPVFCKFALPSIQPIGKPSPLVPNSLSLSVFPNPFNPSTTISFNLPRRAQTSLEIFNLLGQSVYSIDLGQLEAGQHQHHLNAASLPSGSYLTRLDAGKVQDVKRMVLIR